LAFLGAATHPNLKASVAYYPGNLFRAWGRDLPSPFERSPDIRCPIQGHFGADDANPSPDDRIKLDAELSRLGKPHEFHSYENAGHAFLDFTKDSYRKHADEPSWRRTLDFLFQHLNDGS
jgi:carboxymethylenebutenolidase